MEQLIFTLGLTALLVVSVLISSRLAWLFTVKWGPLFAFKPFNCEACATFWLTFASCAAVLWALDDLSIERTLIGAACIGLGNYYRTLSKFNIDE